MRYPEPRISLKLQLRNFVRRVIALRGSTCWLCSVALLCVLCAGSAISNLRGFCKVGKTCFRALSADPGERILISYCPHSGLANQLLSLLSAVHIARLTSRTGYNVTLIVPPVLLTRRFLMRPKDCDLQNFPPWLQACPNISQNTSHLPTAPWSEVLHLESFHTVSFKTIELTETLRTHALQQLGDNYRFIDMQNFTKACGGDRSLQSGDYSNFVRNLHPTRRIWLHFGSVFRLVDPELVLESGGIKYNKTLLGTVEWANREVGQNLSWCAHIRTGGVNAWDVKGASHFPDVWPQTLALFRKRFEAYQEMKSSGLILTDSVDIVNRDITSNFSENVAFKYEQDFGYFHTEILSLPQRLSVSQILCAQANVVFLTPGSTFSEIIRLLKKHNRY